MWIIKRSATVTSTFFTLASRLTSLFERNKMWIQRIQCRFNKQTRRVRIRTGWYWYWYWSFSPTPSSERSKDSAKGSLHAQTTSSHQWRVWREGSLNRSKATTYPGPGGIIFSVNCLNAEYRTPQCISCLDHSCTPVIISHAERYLAIQPESCVRHAPLRWQILGPPNDQAHSYLFKP
jgi:hypothetical protein